MTRDEYEAWRSHPVTKWVMRGAQRAREQERAEWMRISWDNAPTDGKTSAAALIELRTRYDTLDEMINNDFETWSAWNDEQPQRD